MSYTFQLLPFDFRAESANRMAQSVLAVVLLLFFSFTPSYAKCNDADSFDYPVLNKDLDARHFWNVPFNHFAQYYASMGGFHPGEDWNAVGSTPDADLGKPVRAIANGQVAKISRLGNLGNLVAIKHVAPPGEFFFLQQAEGVQNNQIYQYPSEHVSSILSIYVHLDHRLQVAQDECVKKNQIIGYIMDPGGGPHLHFELRHPTSQNSGNWSLVGNKDNWASVGGAFTGYYLNVQEMVNAGLTNPSAFIKRNKSLHSKEAAQPVPSKHGLYFNNRELTKTGFQFIRRPMTSLRIHHYADGKYFVHSNPNLLVRTDPFVFFMVPKRPVTLFGADELKGSVFEVKRSLNIFRVEDNGLFTTVSDGQKHGTEAVPNISIVTNTLHTAHQGLIQQRQQLIKIEVSLPAQEYVFFEGEGNVFDSESYPTKKHDCWHLKITN